MITDTAFYRYVHYHASADTYEKLDYESMGQVVIGLEAAITGLAGSREPERTFHTADISHTALSPGAIRLD